MKMRNFRFLVSGLAVLGLTFSLHAFAGEKANESGGEKEKNSAGHETREASEDAHAQAAPAADSRDQSQSTQGNETGTLRPGMHENADVPVKGTPTPKPTPKN